MVEAGVITAEDAERAKKRLAELTAAGESRAHSDPIKGESEPPLPAS